MMFGILTQKKCSKCKSVKYLSGFGKNKNCKDGLNVWCKECANRHSNEYRKKNPEKTKKVCQAWRENNPEKKKAYALKWYSENKDRQFQTHKVYYENNADKIRAYARERHHANPEYLRNKQREHIERTRQYCRNYRALKKTHGGKITEKEWRHILEKHGYKCLRCGRTDVKLTMDHVVPVSLGGAHSIDNVQPLCGSCNSSKQAQHIDYRPKE